MTNAEIALAGARHDLISPKATQGGQNPIWVLGAGGDVVGRPRSSTHTSNMQLLAYIDVTSFGQRRIAGGLARLLRRSRFEPQPALPRLYDMEKAVHDLLAPIVRSFISDRIFALFQKLANWFEARIPGRATRIVTGFLLGLMAIFSVVTVTALAGF